MSGSTLSDPFGVNAGGNTNNNISDSYKSQQSSIRNSDNLTQEQKDKMIAEMDASISGQQASMTGPWGEAGGTKENATNALAGKYAGKMADLGKEIGQRKVYIQEQFNALNQAVNSKLQQNKVTSFLGATTARAAM